jgi:hypothetical protein
MPYTDLEKQKKYQREWMARRRQEWLTTNGPCVDCGSWDDLQVDHVDASLKINHRVWSWARARRNAELAKCVVRCISCHYQKTRDSGEYRKESARIKIGEANRRRVILDATREKYRQTALRQWRQAREEGRSSLMRKPEPGDKA